MTAIVFCLACDRVMNLSEYLHPTHSCARLEKKHAKPAPRSLFDRHEDDIV